MPTVFNRVKYLGQMSFRLTLMFSRVVRTSQNCRRLYLREVWKRFQEEIT